MSSLTFLATYPMLPDAKSWLREQGPGMDALVTDFVYNRARDRARQRVRAALTGDAIEDPVLLSDIDAEMELLAHPLARLIISATDETYLLNRFAVMESKRLTRALERDPGETVAAIAAELAVPLLRRDDTEDRAFGLGLADFLMQAPNEKAWHLSKRDPHHGIVWLTKEDFVRVLESVYKKKIEDDLAGRSKQVPSLVHEVFSAEIGRLKAEAVERAARFQQANYAEVVPTIFPPCMKRILSDMHDHVNVPHMGRFAIVTFLHTLGMNADEILKFFSSVPDFDPEKSRYQVEHITGRGGPTEYTPPGCGAMQSYGVCPLEERDHVCASIKHPLGYYRKTLWRHEQEKKRGGGNQNANQAPVPAAGNAAAGAGTAAASAEANAAAGTGNAAAPGPANAATPSPAATKSGADTGRRPVVAGSGGKR